MSTILQCSGLTKNYGTFRALDGLNFSLPEGRIVGLLGPNGSGKTTLIKIAAGLLTTGSGTLTIAGNVPGPETKGIVSYLPERTYLSEWMTAEQVIRFFREFYPDFDDKRAREMMQRLGVRLDAHIKSMSKGTKEKVQLILVMSRRARLYLLDEPIGGVDPAARDYILNTIIGNYAENATVVISTHLIADVEKVLDDVIFLSNGKIIYQGAVDDIREREGKSVDALFREVFKC